MMVFKLYETWFLSHRLNDILSFQKLNSTNISEGPTMYKFFPQGGMVS